jgi:hypothetical protein
MIYVAFFEYFTHSDLKNDDNESEGSYTVICEASSAKEVVDDILPRKIVQLGDELSEDDFYIEHFLIGLIELPSPLSAPVVLGVTEGRVMDELPNFVEVPLAVDEEIVRASKLNRITRDKPFFTQGEPPANMKNDDDDGRA